MIKHLAIGFLFVAVLTLWSTEVRAQTPKRIEFAKGKSSATVQGTTGQNGAAYLVRARSGQKLVLTLTPRSGVGIKVETIGRFGDMVLLREERGGTYEVGLEESRRVHNLRRNNQRQNPPRSRSACESSA
jgi:hypothetical protein